MSSTLMVTNGDDCGCSSAITVSAANAAAPADRRACVNVSLAPASRIPSSGCEAAWAVILQQIMTVSLSGGEWFGSDKHAARPPGRAASNTSPGSELGTTSEPGDNPTSRDCSLRSVRSSAIPSR